MIDTHCHLEIENEDMLDKQVKTIQDAGVESIIVSCCTKKEQAENIPFLAGKESIYLALGFHPEEAGKVTKRDLDKLKKQLLSIPNVVALGEIGLDYHYTKEAKEEQRSLFEAQLAIAELLNLPVVIHTRDATLDTIKSLKKYKVKGVIHCFSGSIETALCYIEMGFKLGIGGVVTFNNSHLKDVVEKVPLSALVLETDSPYLCPEPFRGKKNDPKYIPFIAKKIAEIKQTSISSVEKITTVSADEIFDLSLTEML